MTPARSTATRRTPGTPRGLHSRRARRPYHHEVAPPLRGWTTTVKYRQWFLENGFIAPHVVAVRVRLAYLDRVLDYPPHRLGGQPGIVPDRERVFLHHGTTGAGWFLIPAHYLDQIDPAWLEQVRWAPGLDDLIGPGVRARLLRGA